MHALNHLHYIIHLNNFIIYIFYVDARQDDASEELTSACQIKFAFLSLQTGYLQGHRKLNFLEVYLQSFLSQV